MLYKLSHKDFFSPSYLCISHKKKKKPLVSITIYEVFLFCPNATLPIKKKWELKNRECFLYIYISMK